MQKALLLANKTCSVTSYRAILDQLKDQVVAGKTFPEGLQASGIFPPAVLSLASIGDAVNGLPKVLTRAADILDDETTQLQKRILAALTPAITILMGLLIGSLVISVMSALLSINELSLQ
jgi:general secretion pathway protein F